MSDATAPRYKAVTPSFRRILRKTENKLLYLNEKIKAVQDHMLHLIDLLSVRLVKIHTRFYLLLPYGHVLNQVDK